MEIAKLVLQYLQLLISWPVACTFLVLYFFIKFRETIERFFSRITEGDFLGVKIKAAEQRQELKEIEAKAVIATEAIDIGQSQSEKSTTELASKPDFQRFKENVLNKPEETYKVLGRMAMELGFERAYNLIWQAQIHLLKHLYWKGPEGDTEQNLSQYFKPGSTLTTHTSYEYKNFLGFLEDSGLVQVRPGDEGRIYSLTPKGRGFLTYIGKMGYPDKIY